MYRLLQQYDYQLSTGQDMGVKSLTVNGDKAEVIFSGKLAYADIRTRDARNLSKKDIELLKYTSSEYSNHSPGKTAAGIALLAVGGLATLKGVRKYLSD